MGEHRNAGGGVSLLLAEKVHQFTCDWRTIHVMLGLQSRDHAKKRKENTGKRLEGNISKKGGKGKKNNRKKHNKRNQQIINN